MRHLLLATLVGLASATGVPAADWSFWRGPEQTGVSRERDLPEKWSLATKENVIFTSPHGSITTPIVQDGQVYLLGKCGVGETQQERVFACNADTGKLVWEHKLNVYNTDIVDDRIGFTHVVGDRETGYVYAHGTAGDLLCFDKAGKVVWQRQMTEEFGRITGYGGRVTSPIIDEDKVILTMVCSSWGELTVGMTRLVALDKKTGKVIWWGSGMHRVKDTYYACPVVAVINGVRTILSGGGDGCLHAFKVRTGERLWSVKFEDGGGAINCSPVVSGNKIWVGHGEENQGNGTQGRIICVDASVMEKGSPKIVWKHDGLKAKFAAPILHEKMLYVCDDAGKLTCFDAEKGEELWTFAYGRNTKGSPVWADGKIYVSEVDSRFHILKPAADDCQRLHQAQFRGAGVTPVELHGAPAVVNGRVYFTTTEQLICIGKPGHKTPADKIPAPVAEPAEVGKPAWLQVVPADVTLDPGESEELKAVAYDANGRRVGETKVTWKKDGMLGPVYPVNLKAPATPKAAPPPAVAGELSAADGVSTKFTAAKIPNGQFGRIVAEAGPDLKGHARIRVTPTVPYLMNFKLVPDGRTPAAWVNAMAKFNVITLPDGTKVLRKRNDNANPLVARANAYISSPHRSDYTIECDVFGTKVRDKDMPDIGIGASRYSLTLIGNDHELRLVTWDAQKRIEKKLAYNWKPGVWYRMKLMATVVDGKGVVKGKVWERDAKEPGEWTLELEDPIPNAEGAPLIYGFVNGTIDEKSPGPEIHYANLTITPNKK